MDIATVIGVILGAVLIVSAIVMGGDMRAYVNAPSVLIVIGGAMGATMASFPLARFLKLPKVFMKAFFAKSADSVTLIQQLVELAEVARRDGILALENMTDQVDDAFLVSGIQMAVDGTDPEVIQACMETELRRVLAWMR